MTIKQLDLLDALYSDLGTTEARERLREALSCIASAELAALCFQDTQGAYVWFDLGIPPTFFLRYPEMEKQDFVREGVTRAPGVPVRDGELISRCDLRENPMYKIAREENVPMERVMSVLIPSHKGWHGGLTLYRSHSMEFSEADSARLAEVSESLMWALTAQRRAYFDEQRSRQLLSATGRQVAIVDGHGRDVFVGAGARDVLEVLDRRMRAEIRRYATQLARAHPCGEPISMTYQTPAGDVLVGVESLAGQQSERWARVTISMLLPVEWSRRLTQAQRRVALGILDGNPDKDIAAALGVGQDTVKKHARAVYDRLGLDGRSHFLAKALASELRGFYGE